MWPCFGCMQTPVAPHLRPTSVGEGDTPTQARNTVCYFCGARFHLLRRRYTCSTQRCHRYFCDRCGIVLDGKAKAVCSHHAREYLRAQQAARRGVR